jgi:hypothetical protein
MVFALPTGLTKRYLGRVMKRSLLNVDAWVQTDPL